MPTPILATKLFLPPPRPASVLRTRLLARLNQGLSRKLTLLSAPAGFGKTTLVSGWLTSTPQLTAHAVAWLSLDEADNDPRRFLAYFVAALQTVAPQVGEGVLAMLDSSQLPPIESLLTTLLNEIAPLPAKIVLVLDDYHVIDSRAIDHALIFLLEHLPPQLHLVITTREDPPFPLARLRARGQLSEVRATDLRFSADEAADFLNQVMGLSLSIQEVATLESRTEGWIAGLQLAALSMQGHTDVAGFIRAFAGDHRYIVDYLVEEVLQRQSPSVQSFLLHTSVLERLCGALCDAVTQQSEGNARLEALGRGNFFVVPLDDKRHWYRYHHLFADVLQARLKEEQPDLVPVLHQRASAWFADNALPAEAIRHALAAKDFARAASLVELAVPAMRQNRRESTLLGWFKALPDEVVRNRPVLSNDYAGALMSSGIFEGVEPLLRNAERWLEMGTQAHGEMIVADAAAFRALPASLAVYRAGYALAQGNLAQTVHHARRALEVVPDDEHLWHGAAAAILGLASWANGELEDADRAYAEGMASMQRAQHLADVIGCAVALADIRVAQGRLGEAMRTYERALQLTTQPGVLVPRGTADLYVGMSELLLERNDLPAALEHLRRSKELGELAALPRYHFRWCVVMARIRAAEGDLEGAHHLLSEAERLYVSDFFPNVLPLAALKARLWVAQGRLVEALRWVREEGLSVTDDLHYLREFEHITLARVRLAQAKSDPDDRHLLDISEFLARLLSAAEAGGRKGSTIEIRILQALAHHLQGDAPAASAALQHALTLAEPEGYVRMFVAEGAPLAHLLERTAQRGFAPHYLRHLLDAFGAPAVNPSATQAIPTPRPPSTVEPLSERELDVLRLLGTDMSGPEIADALMVSLNTMRTHTKNIYAKLGVNNRREAVRLAEELALI